MGITHDAFLTGATHIAAGAVDTAIEPTRATDAPADDVKDVSIFATAGATNNVTETRSERARIQAHDILKQASAEGLLDKVLHDIVSAEKEPAEGLVEPENRPEDIVSAENE